MHNRLFKPLGYLTGSLIVVLTLATLQRAYATTTVPNASKTTLNAPIGGDSGNMTLASSTGPVEVIIAHTTVGSRGVSMAVMQAPTTSPLLQWTGVDSDGNSFSNYTTTAGTLMYQVGYLNAAQLISGGTSSFHLHNNNLETSDTIVVTQMW